LKTVNVLYFQIENRKGIINRLYLANIFKYKIENPETKNRKFFVEKNFFYYKIMSNYESVFVNVNRNKNGFKIIKAIIK